MKSILCFGDSITYGESDVINGGWVSLLARYYQNKESTEAHLKTLVYNLGIASETTDGLKRRFQSEYQNRLLAKSTSIVILSYGINDIVIHKNKNKVPQEYFIKNLQHCIDVAKKGNAILIINSLLDFSQDFDGKKNQHLELRYLADIKRYNQSLRELSKHNDCVFNELNYRFTHDRDAQYLAEDGLHPNSDGHQLIFSEVVKQLDNINAI